MRMVRDEHDETEKGRRRKLEIMTEAEETFKH